MTVDDIETGAGYPFQFPNKLHCRTLIVFTYRRDNELCRAVADAPRLSRRRRRELTFQEAQVSLNDEQILLARTVVAEIVQYQM